MKHVWCRGLESRGAIFLPNGKGLCPSCKTGHMVPQSEKSKLSWDNFPHKDLVVALGITTEETFKCAKTFKEEKLSKLIETSFMYSVNLMARGRIYGHFDLLREGRQSNREGTEAPKMQRDDSDAEAPYSSTSRAGAREKHFPQTIMHYYFKTFENPISPSNINNSFKVNVGRKYQEYTTSKTYSRSLQNLPAYKANKYEEQLNKYPVDKLVLEIRDTIAATKGIFAAMIRTIALEYKVKHNYKNRVNLRTKVNSDGSKPGDFFGTDVNELMIWERYMF